MGSRVAFPHHTCNGILAFSILQPLCWESQEAHMTLVQEEVTPEKGSHADRM